MSARTPLIAGNWKMYKTEAQAEDYIQALLPRVSSVDGVEVAICVPFTDLRAMVDSARGSRVEVYAQNMHHEPEGAFTGEVSPAMLSEIGVQGVVLGHSERRACFGETDRALALKVPAALEAGLRPILCVGETEEERDKDETQRKLRQQVRDGLAGVADERLAEVTIAYEPIWAIGTGRVASPEQAQEAIAFVRALVGDRDKQAAERVRILYGGSVKPENAAELLALPDVDGALVGGASWRPSRSRRSWPPPPRDEPARRSRRVTGAERLPGGARRVGARRARPRQRRVAGEHAGVRRALGDLSAHDADRVRARGRAAGRPDGQQRGRTPEPRRGRGRAAGSDADRRRGRGRDARRERGPAGGAGEARTGAPARARVRRGRAFEHGSPARADRAGGHAAWSADGEGTDLVVHAFTDGRDTLPHSGADFLAELDATEGVRMGSVVGRYWAMDRDRRWDRTQRAYDLLVHGCAARRADSGEEAVRGAYERGETDEFIEPTLVGAEAQIRPGDSVLCFNFRPDRMRQLTRALAEEGFGEGGAIVGRMAAARRMRVDDGDGREELPGWIGRGGAKPVEIAGYTTLTEYEEGWPYPVVFPPERPRRRSGSCWRQRGPSSCTWPRPRSTRM